MDTTQESLEMQLRAATRGVACVIQHAPGCVEVCGREGLDLLHRISTNDLQGLSPGSARKTVFLDAKGRIVDLVTAAIQQEQTLLLCSAGGEEKLVSWIEKFVISEDVTTKDVTADFTIIRLIGIETISTASFLIEADVLRNTLVVAGGDLGPVLAVTIGGKTGDEVVLLVEGGGGGEAGRQVLDRLKSLGVLELQERAWEIYRIMRGIPLAGAEISEQYNPYDVGLIDFVSFKKGCYVGQEVIARLDTFQKARRSLFGLRFSERPTDISLPIRLKKEEAEAGVCTSLSASPYQGEHLGLAVLRRDVVSQGDLLSVEGSAISCRVSSIPRETASE